jgi:lysophospholipase L1-like esterase
MIHQSAPLPSLVERGTAEERTAETAPPALFPSHPRPEFHDFGDPNFRKLAQKTRALKNQTAPMGTVLRIVQFGDSHTASDTITSGLRRLLQQRFGNAGIGWIAPMKTPGQNHSLVKYESNGWELSTSRNANEARQKIFPLGGYIATPVSDNASISVIPRAESADLWKARVSLKQWKAPLILTDARKKRIVIEPSRPFGLWRDAVIASPLRLPFTITAGSSGDADLGGIWLEKNRASGVTVSAIGLNGVTLKNWEYWSMPHQWTRQLTASKADMVILAYGTNEAIQPRLDIADMKNILRKSVLTVRDALPDSAIVIVGAPDALHAKEAGDCGERIFPMLREVKRAQREIAEKMKTLFWDWQTAMGGPCSMEDWFAEGLAKEDRIHFSLAGYQKSAEFFYDDLMVLIDKTLP